MKLLIQQALVVDPASPHNGQIADLIITHGKIASIGKYDSQDADRVIDIPGLCVSPGWVDLFADFADPGYEFRETLETGSAAAAAGGFTDVFLIPNTQPVIHNKAGVEYLTHKGRLGPVHIHPIGAISRNTEGKDLAEMYDMRQSGAVSFSDGWHPVQSAGLLVKALQYVKAFDGVLIQLPEDRSIQPQGLIHEGLVSTRLGLPGKPALAEELMVARDVKLAQYAESRLHITGISTLKSAAYIREAKENGAGVSCSVTPLHLFFCDEDLTGYDTNLKVSPPLRDREEMLALRESVKNGTIDCIASHHQPQDTDGKIVEFEYAKPGVESLETVFAACQTAVPGLDPLHWVRMLAVRPRELFGLPPASLTEGNEACITLFHPGQTWTVRPEDIRSKSRNNPFIGRELTGKPLGIVRGSQVFIA